MKKLLTLLSALVIGAFLLNPNVQAATTEKIHEGRFATVIIDNNGSAITITIMPVRSASPGKTFVIPIPSTTAAKSPTYKVNNEAQLEAIIKETLTKAKVSKSSIQSILQQIDDELEDVY